MNQHALKNVLLGNAMFSTACGVLLVIAPDTFANLMGSHPEWIYLALGIGLLVFAADVAWVATRKTINKTFATAILWADIGWVTGSAMLLVLGASLFSTMGLLLVVAIALIVAVLSALEYRAIHQSPLAA